MKATAAYIRVLNKGKLYAKADVVFDNVLTVKGFSVFANQDGSFGVSLPSTLGKGKDKETGEVIEKWWSNIWIKKDTEEGAALLADIDEQITLSIRKENHASERTNTILNQTEKDLLDDGDLF